MGLLQVTHHESRPKSEAFRYLSISWGRLSLRPSLSPHTSQCSGSAALAKANTFKVHGIPHSNMGASPCATITPSECLNVTAPRMLLPKPIHLKPSQNRSLPGLCRCLPQPPPYRYAVGQCLSCPSEGCSPRPEALWTLCSLDFTCTDYSICL